MTLDLSRRAVVVGLGCAGLAANGASKALAGVVHGPDLEALFDPARLTKLKALYRAGKPVPDHMCLDLLFDANGRFRVSRNFREGMTRFLRNGAPVEIILLDDDVRTASGRGAWQPSIDAAVADIVRKFGLLPPGTHFAMPFADPVRFCYWQGEDWREAGWPPPSDTEYWCSCSIHYEKPKPWPELLI